jgi:hypothetical protein
LGTRPVSIRELPGTLGKRMRSPASESHPCAQELAGQASLYLLQDRRLSPAHWALDTVRDLTEISERIPYSRNNIFVLRVRL